jgi:hypothetical protein
VTDHWSRLAPITIVGLLLVLATPAAGSPQLRRPTQRQVPDWRVVYAESLPPLTFRQIETATREATNGPRLENLRVTSTPWDAGDRRLLTTISPNGDTIRDKAIVDFEVAQPTTVTMSVMACSKHSQVIAVDKERFIAGKARMVWAPPRKTIPRTYLLVLRAHGKRADAGLRKP